MSKSTALITGASGGIGLEFARIHANNKFDLVLAARNEEKLNQIKNELESQYRITVFVYATDLTKHENVLALIEYTNTHNIQIDHVINNAGFGVFGKLSETSIDQNLNMIQLNIDALVTLTHAYSKKMIVQGQGKILNVASTAAFMSGPYMSVYFASKAFVLSFSEAVHSELSGTGVSVTTLCPGPTATGFEDAAEGMNKSGLFSKQKVSTASAVAMDGYQAMMSQKPLVISGIMNKISALSVRLTPRSWVKAITKSIMKPVG